MFSNHWEEKICQKIVSDLNKFTKKILKYRAFVAKVDKVFKTKKIVSYSTFM
jgi:hypothetical protein